MFTWIPPAFPFYGAMTLTWFHLKYSTCINMHLLIVFRKISLNIWNNIVAWKYSLTLCWTEPVPEPVSGPGGHGLTVTSLPEPAAVQGCDPLQLHSPRRCSRSPALHKRHRFGVFAKSLHPDSQHLHLLHRPIRRHDRLLGHPRGSGCWRLDRHVPHWWEYVMDSSYRCCSVVCACFIVDLSFTDEVLSENFLDYKSRGVSGSHKGQIVWRIDTSLYFIEGKCSFLLMLSPAFVCSLEFLSALSYCMSTLIQIHWR